jgi:hypothetical protein
MSYTSAYLMSLTSVNWCAMWIAVSVCKVNGPHFTRDFPCAMAMYSMIWKQTSAILGTKNNTSHWTAKQCVTLFKLIIVLRFLWLEFNGRLWLSWIGFPIFFVLPLQDYVVTRMFDCISSFSTGKQATSVFHSIMDSSMTCYQHQIYIWDL